MARRRRLSHLAAHVSTIEINGSFHRLQQPSNYRKWATETPDDFLFAVKGSRLITHHKRLRHVEDALKTFVSSLAPEPSRARSSGSCRPPCASTSRPRGTHDDEQLDEWARKIREWDRDTYMHFDNTMKGAAAGNARALARRLGTPLRSHT